MNTASLSRAATAPAPTPPQVPLRADAAVIGLVGLAHASSHFAHLLLPPLFPVFAQEFGLSFSQLGFLMTVFFVISGTGQASAGFLVDKVGARPVLFASFVSFICACLAGYFAQGYWGLMLVAMFAGLGNAPFHPVDFSILNQRVSPHRLGYAFSAHGLSGNLGWALTPVFLLFFTAWQGWRSGYLAAAILYACILAVLVLHRRHLKTEVVRRAHDAPKGSDVAFLRLPVVWWCFAFFLLSTMTLAVVQAFASPIMQAMHGVSFEAATTMITAYMLCGAAGMFAGGFVAARMPAVTRRGSTSSVAPYSRHRCCISGRSGTSLSMLNRPSVTTRMPFSVSRARIAASSSRTWPVSRWRCSATLRVLAAAPWRSDACASWSITT